MTYRERLNRTCKYYDSYCGMTTTFKTEAEFLRIVTAFLETAGALVVRQAYATKNGVSDLICCYRGRFLAFELKDDEGTPSPQQLNFLQEVVRNEGTGLVVDHLLQISIVLANILKDLGE